MLNQLREAARLHRSGRLSEAEALYSEVLRRDSSHPDALHLWGVLAHQQGRSQAALTSIAQAIRQNDRNWSYHSNLGNVLQSLGRYDEAIAAHQRAVELAPERAELWSNLGTCHQEAGRAEAAEAAYRRALARDAQHADTHYNLGNLLREQGRQDDSITCYERAIALAPEMPEPYFNLAHVLLAQKRFDEAERRYRWGLERRPDDADARLRLARLLRQRGAWPEARIELDRVLQQRPDLPAAHVQRSMARLALGDLAGGWEEFDWRWQCPRGPRRRQLPLRNWSGDPITCRQVLLHAETSLCDQLQFGTCIPDVIEDARRVVVECHPQVGSLFARSFPTAMIVTRTSDGSTPWLQQALPLDLHFPLSDAPRYLRPTPERFPRRRQYLLPCPDRIESWAARLSQLGPGLKVGVAWRRTIPDGMTGDCSATPASSPSDWGIAPGDLLRPLLDHASVQFLALHELHASDLSWWPRTSRTETMESLQPPTDDKPIESLAALVRSLDLVITLDELVAHLAGGVGTSTWLWTSAASNWRWLPNGHTSLWYPSVRLFRSTGYRYSRETGAEISRELIAFASHGRRCATGTLLPAEDAQPSPRAARPSLGNASPDDAARLSLALPGERRPLLAAADNASNETHAAVEPSPDRARMTDYRWGLSDATVEESLAQARRLNATGDHSSAEGICREIVRLQPSCAAAWALWGTIAAGHERHAEATEALGHAANLEPHNARYCYELALALHKADRLADAISMMQRAVELNPQHPEAVLNLGSLLEKAGRLDESIVYCRRAAELVPNFSRAHYNLANVLLHKGLLTEAIDHYERTTELEPQFAKAHWNAGLAQLLAGNFGRGWQGYEWRQRAGEVYLDDFAEPRWDGSSLEGRTILIHAEQGVGDEIMFATCFPDVLAQARHCIITCCPRLVSLFRRSFPQASVYGVARKENRSWRPPEPFDCQIPAGSLPFYLRRNWASFPRQDKLLVVDPEKLDKWRKRFASLGDGIKVGISWRGGGKAAEQKRRTTQLEVWREFLATPGVQFVNLQYGCCEADLRLAREEYGVTIHDWYDADPMKDLDQFAAEVAALDLVVSVGNTTIHTAGAVGTPAWAILPFVPGWRYLLGYDEMPWYRGVKLLRQTTPDDDGWRRVLQFAKQRLNEYRQERRSSSDTSSCAVRQVDPGDIVATTSRVAAPDPSAADAPRAPLSSEVIRERIQEAIGLQQQGRLELADQICCDILDRHPDVADALHLLGVIALVRGQASEAVSLIRQAIAIQGGQANFHFNLGTAFRRLGREPEAIEEYRRAVHSHLAFAEARLNLAELLLNSGQHAEALTHFEQAVAAAPDDAKMHHGHGNALLELRQYEAAAAAFRRAIECNSSLVDAHVNLAVALLKSRRWEEAQRELHAALEAHPDDSRLLANLAVVHQKRGQLHAAVDTYRRALERSPGDTGMRINMALALEGLGLATQAEAEYRQAISINPRAAKAWHGLGTLELRRGNAESALECFEHTLTLDARHTGTVDNLALALLDLNRPDEACRRLEAAIQIEPNHSGHFKLLAQAHLKCERLDAALTALCAGLKVDPQRTSLYDMQGTILLAQQRYSEAAEAFARSVELRPDGWQALRGCGFALRRAGRPVEARGYYDRATQQRGCPASVWDEVGCLSMELGEIDEAVALLEHAVHLDPSNASIHVNLAEALFLRGDLSAAWEHYEWRLRTPAAEPSNAAARRPRWEGSDLSGRRILVTAEQGVGDEVMFASCLPDVMAQAAHCVVECDARLVPLFARSFPHATVRACRRSGNATAVASLDDDVWRAVDAYVPAGSLPRCFRPTLESFPSRRHYLLPDQTEVDRWRRQLSALGPALKVGISWRGGTTEMERRRRTVPPKLWRPLLDVAGVEFICVQYGVTERELADFPADTAGRLTPFEHPDPLDDLDGFAALLAALDIVISVTNTTVHLAGALGTPTWALVAPGSSWRWLHGRSDSPWYPSVRIWRPQISTGWEPVMAELSQQLRQAASQAVSRSRLPGPHVVFRGGSASTVSTHDHRRAATTLLQPGKDDRHEDRPNDLAH